jgi:hypothetical protein
MNTRAADNAKKAYDLRDRVGLRERFAIDEQYRSTEAAARVIDNRTVILYSTVVL